MFLKKIRKLAWVSTLAFAWSGSLLAFPTEYPENPHAFDSIANPTASRLIADSKDPAQFWVLPPRTGQTSPQGFRPGNPNLQFCRQMNDLRNRSSNLATRFNLSLALLAELRQERNRETSFSKRTQLLERINQVKSDLAAATLLVTQMYAKFAQLEGGFSKIIYESGWAENLTILSTLNPGFRFSTIPTRNMKLSVSYPGGGGREAYLSSIPVILKYSINGTEFLPFGPPSYPSSDEVNSHITANLTLSLGAACPILFPQNYPLARNEAGLPWLDVSTTYEYATTHLSQVQYSYNLYKIFELMKNTTRGTGLFGAQEWAAVLSSEWSEDLLRLETYTDAPYPSGPTLLRNQVKEDLISRILRIMSSTVPLPAGDLDSMAAAADGHKIMPAYNEDARCARSSLRCGSELNRFRGDEMWLFHETLEDSFRASHDRQESDSSYDSEPTYKSATTLYNLDVQS